MSSRTGTAREDDEDQGVSFGAAAAVIGLGVGIGAALYYFLKPSEQPQQNSAQRNQRERTLSVQSKVKEENFRERAWTLEQCSICVEPMLVSSELYMLPCGHKYHMECVNPWVASKGTCPNCRKAV